MPKVLLIEDDPRVAKPMLRVIEKAGASRVDWAPSAATAVTQTTRAHYDILVSDFDLGTEAPTGVDVLDELRSTHPDALYVCISGSPRAVPHWVQFMNKMDLVGAMAALIAGWGGPD